MGIDNYVDLRYWDDKPVIEVETSAYGKHRFPLTRSGCVAAGRHLYACDAKEWRCGSQVDFPEDLIPRFRYDVKELLLNGWSKARYKNSVRSKVFWFHYNKPESLRQKKNILTVHQSGVCHLVTDIVCNVPIHTAHRSSQPRCVLKGKGVVRVVEGVATIDAK